MWIYQTIGLFWMTFMDMLIFKLSIIKKNILTKSYYWSFKLRIWLNKNLSESAESELKYDFYKDLDSFHFIKENCQLLEQPIRLFSAKTKYCIELRLHPFECTIQIQMCRRIQSPSFQEVLKFPFFTVTKK